MYGFEMERSVVNLFARNARKATELMNMIKENIDFLVFAIRWVWCHTNLLN
jgi:hypothetical protein